MRYAQITPFEVCNGKGAGVSLFVQGCRFKCKGCFNQDAWDFNGGKEWTEEIEKKFFELVDRPYIKRVSILGGEPLANENRKYICNLIEKLKVKFPDKTIWLYTGYTLEELCEEYTNEQIYNLPSGSPNHDNVLKNISYVDVLVDGRFVENERDVTLSFRGSRNQRLIDMPETLKEQEIVLYN